MTCDRLVLPGFSGTQSCTCLFADLSRVSSPSPALKLNYRRGNVKLTGDQGASRLLIVYIPFPLSMKLHETLHFIHSDFGSTSLLSTDLGEVLSLLSILTLTISGTKADPRSAAQEAALLCC